MISMLFKKPEEAEPIPAAVDSAATATATPSGTSTSPPPAASPAASDPSSGAAGSRVADGDVESAQPRSTPPAPALPYLHERGESADDTSSFSTASSGPQLGSVLAMFQQMQTMQLQAQAQQQLQQQQFMQLMQQQMFAGFAAIQSSKGDGSPKGIAALKAQKTVNEYLDKGNKASRFTPVELVQRLTEGLRVELSTGILPNLGDLLKPSLDHQSELAGFSSNSAEKNKEAYFHMVCNLVSKWSSAVIPPFNTPNVSTLNALETLTVLRTAIELHFGLFSEIEKLCEAAKVPVPGRTVEVITALPPGLRQLLASTVPEGERYHSPSASAKDESASTISASDASIAALAASFETVDDIVRAFKTLMSDSGALTTQFTFMTQPGLGFADSRTAYQQNVLQVDNAKVSRVLNEWATASNKSGGLGIVIKTTKYGNDKYGSDGRHEHERVSERHSELPAAGAGRPSRKHGNSNETPTSSDPSDKNSENKTGSKYEKKVVAAMWHDVDKNYESIERPKGALIVARDCPGPEIFKSQEAACAWAMSHPFFSYPTSWGSAFGNELHNAFKHGRRDVAMKGSPK